MKIYNQVYKYLTCVMIGIVLGLSLAYTFRYRMVAQINLRGEENLSRTITGGDLDHANPTETQLIEKLKNGRHLVFVRHGQTQLDKTYDDPQLNFDKCEEQRDLSAAGVEVSKQVGEAFSKLDIKFEKAYASPYCRTKKTSELMFFDAEEIIELSGLKSKEDVFNYSNAGLLLIEFINSIKPVDNANIAVTAHWGGFMSAYGVHLGEGDLAVFEYNNDEWNVIGVIHPATLNDYIHDRVRDSINS